MAMPPRPQAVVVSACRRVRLDARAGPVVERLAQAPLTGVAHVDEEGPLPAALRDGSHAGVRPQRGIIPLGHRASSLGEHRGRDESSDPWQGLKDVHVTMLARFTLELVDRCQCGQRPINIAIGGEALGMDQQQLRHERGDPYRDRVGDPSGHGQRGLAERGHHVVHGDTANAVRSQGWGKAPTRQVRPGLGMRRRR